MFLGLEIYSKSFRMMFYQKWEKPSFSNESLGKLYQGLIRKRKNKFKRNSTKVDWFRIGVNSKRGGIIRAKLVISSKCISFTKFIKKWYFKGLR